MIDLLFFSESTYYFEQKQQIILYLINDRVSPCFSKPHLINTHNNNTKLGKLFSFSFNPRTKRNSYVKLDSIKFISSNNVREREEERTKGKEKWTYPWSLSVRSKEYEGLDTHFRRRQLFSITLRPLSKLRRHLPPLSFEGGPLRAV